MPATLKWPAALDELRPLLGGSYPAFVYAPAPAALPAGAVPVFMFHTIRADVFEDQLRYLAENGYRTPSLDEFHRFLAGEAALAPARVLLTVDDVERGLLTAGVPLLRKYGLRCVAFLAAGRIETAERAVRPPTGKAWPTWSEARELLASGVVDIGAHTLNHARIFTGSRPVDFVHPGIFVDGLGLDNPMVRQDGQDRVLEDLGAPLFPAAPRLGLRRRYFDNEQARAACVRFVAEHGGPEFFRQAGWRARLAAHWRARAAGAGRGGQWETADEQRDAIRRELTDSRAMLEDRLGCPVRDFAYPWATGSALAAELVRAAGYRTAFWGPLRDARVNRPGQDPFRVARLKEDYLFRLPGKGRRSLLDILRLKARRRRESRDIY